MISENPKHSPAKFLSAKHDKKPRSSRSKKKDTYCGTHSNYRAHEESRIQESLLRAFDENDSLRSRIVELESLLVVVQIERNKRR